MKTKRMPVTIDGVEFKSNAALKRHVQAMVAGTPDGEMMAPADTAFVVELVRARHPWAEDVLPPGVPVVGVRVLHESGRELLGKGNGNHALMVTATGERPFAWAKCCTGFDRGSIVAVTLRLAVADQTVAFKKRRFGFAEAAACEATGEPVRWDECHVDHFGTPFRDIAAAFMSRHGLTFDNITLEHLKTGGYVLADHDQAAAWAEWHRRHANLRIVRMEKNVSDGTHADDVRAPSEKQGRVIPTSGSATVDYGRMPPDEIAAAEAHVRMVIEQARAYAADIAGDAVTFAVACDRADEIGLELIRLKAIVQARLDAEATHVDRAG